MSSSSYYRRPRQPLPALPPRRRFPLPGRRPILIAGALLLGFLAWRNSPQVQIPQVVRVAPTVTATPVPTRTATALPTRTPVRATPTFVPLKPDPKLDIVSVSFVNGNTCKDGHTPWRADITLVGFEPNSLISTTTTVTNAKSCGGDTYSYDWRQQTSKRTDEKGVIQAETFYQDPADVKACFMDARNQSACVTFTEPTRRIGR